MEAAGADKAPCTPAQPARTGKPLRQKAQNEPRSQQLQDSSWPPGTELTPSLTLGDPQQPPRPSPVPSLGSPLSQCRRRAFDSCWNCPLEGQCPCRATALSRAGSAGLYQPKALQRSQRSCMALSMACVVRSVSPISNPPHSDLGPSCTASGLRPTLSAHREAGPAYQGVKDKCVIDIRVRILHHDGEQGIQCVLEKLGVDKRTVRARALTPSIVPDPPLSEGAICQGTELLCPCTAWSTRPFVRTQLPSFSCPLADSPALPLQPPTCPSSLSRPRLPDGAIATGRGSISPQGRGAETVQDAPSAPSPALAQGSSPCSGSCSQHARPGCQETPGADTAAPGSFHIPLPRREQPPGAVAGDVCAGAGKGGGGREDPGRGLGNVPTVP